MKFILLFFLAVSSVFAHGNPEIEFEAFIEEGCLDPVNKIAKEYLSSHQSQVDQMLSKRFFKRLSLNLDSVHVCGVDDLEAGSYQILRQTRICAVAVAPKDPQLFLYVDIYLLTRGDLYCTREKVLEIQSVRLR